MSSEKLYKDLRGLYGLPMFIANKESNYIIVEGSESNKAHFDDYFKINQALSTHGKIPTDTNIYYYEPEDFDMIIKEMARIEDLAQAKKRQEKIDNPEINRKLKENVIGTLTLIDFLMGEYRQNREYDIGEYSNDVEVSEAILKAEMKYMSKIVENELKYM